MQKINKNIVHKFKFCAIWSDDEIEKWLQEMAAQGLHLRSVNIFNRYSFIRGTPAQVSYCLDFVPNLNRDGDYYGLFLDAGWEHVIEFTGWQYWRKTFTNGQAPHIFTDVESKIKKFKRALALISIISTLSLLALSAGFLMETPLEQRMRGENSLQSIGLVAAVGMHLYFAYKIISRIRQLRQSQI